MGSTPRKFDSESADPFDVSVELDGDVAFVEVVGELDMVTADGLRAALIPFFGTYKTVVFELGALTFLDTSGFRAIEDVTDAEECDLIIKHPSPQVRRFLFLIGYAQWMNATSSA